MAYSGGLEHISEHVALVFGQQKAELLIPLYDLHVEGTQEQLIEVKPKSADKEDDVYLYEEIKAAVNNMEPLDDDVYGADAHIVLAKNIIHPAGV